MDLVLKADADAQRIEVLEMELADLRGDLAAAELTMKAERQQNARAIGMLRKQLTPLYQALRAVFGEMDAIGGGEYVDDGGGNQMPARVKAVWESWKQKLPGKPAEFIDILLQHGEMTAAQLKIAGRCAGDTVYQTIYKLNRAGLINKNGGKFSLKEL